ncbi:MAG: lysophospholipid acyltransferase family protein [Planctomycetaceae bacterium]|nr:lysophospholipid acyltransferase family protein [Planctomycetaceae bacterium]
MTWLQLRHRLEYIGFRLATCLIGMLSVRQTKWLGEHFAWLMTDVLPHSKTRYHVARENIQSAFPGEYTPAEIHQLIQDMWLHLFRVVAETVQFSRKMTLSNCREVIVFRNRRAAVKALCSGRPVFVLGGHFGNWEASIATFGVFDFRMGVVGRELDNPYLHEWFARSRELTGHKLLLKQGGWDDMTALLQAGGNLGLLCDQDAGKRGVFVDFFGKPASTFKSIALMALEHKAILIVGYGIRLPDDFDNARWAQFEIGCEEVIDTAEITGDDEVRQITERYTAALESAIRRAPEQYFWVHRRWKTEPRQKRQTQRQREAA